MGPVSYTHLRFGPIRWLRAMVVAVAEAATLRYEVVGFSNTAEDFNNLQPGREMCIRDRCRTSARR